MTKFILIGAVILLSFGAFRVWKHGLFPKAAMPHAVAAVAHTPSATPEPTHKKGEDGSYDIKTSRLVACADGNDWMQLESGTYQKGKMSADGYCDAVRDRVARIHQPNGRLMFVVADDQAQSAKPTPAPHTEVAHATASATPSVIIATMPTLFPETPEDKLHK
jgi:hypothetical protein